MNSTYTMFLGGRSNVGAGHMSHVLCTCAAVQVFARDLMG